VSEPPPTAIPEPHDDEPEAIEDDVAPDDGGEEGGDRPPEGDGITKPHPLDEWSDERVARAVAEDLASLGCMSVGSPSAGILINGRQAEAKEFYEPVSRGSAWGTEETFAYLDAALAKVHREKPGTPPLSLGDVSAERGGRISPHVSHQAGRDVDISYFYKEGARWYRRGNAQNLDIARNWAFVRALVTETDVEMIFIDHSIQALLREHALSIGEDAAWVDSIFKGGAGRYAIVRHARGHATHIHVRFYNPLAQETARRAYPALVARGVIPPVQSFLQHHAKRGDTLGKIAKKYGVSVVAIKRANRLKNSLIREKRTYLIPVARPRPAAPGRRLTLPPRRLPPSESASPRAVSSTSQ
jgi:murein endopeptidase